MTFAVCHGTTRTLRRTMRVAPVVLMLAVAAGCTQPPPIHKIGDNVEVGGLVYTIAEADWMNDIQTGGGTRTPQQKFLVIRLSIRNTSNKEVTLPLLNAVKGGPGGAEMLELSESSGIEDWLGVLRTLNPTETKTGRIVFDMPMGAYVLRLTDGAEPDKEKTAFVAMPDKIREGMTSPLLNAPSAPNQ